MPGSGEMWWILIAEDEIEVREMFRNAILKKVDSLGMLAHVVEAKDGAEAIQKASARAFDCIVTDLRMPTTTGETMVRTIQSQPLNFNTPVIVISAHAREEFQNFSREYEHIRFLDKPCTPDEVSETVLKELNYGKRDERVSVHLFSPFIKSVTKRFRLPPENLQKPFIKRSGLELHGDIHCVLRLRSEFSQAYFCISFDESIFQETALQENNEDVIAVREPTNRLTTKSREITFELIDMAMDQLKICLGGNPRLKGLKQFLVRRNEDSSQAILKNATAVTVAIETAKGKIYLSALMARDFSMLNRGSSAA